MRTMLMRLGAVSVLLALGAATSGCDEVRRTLGFDRTPPDEFRTVSRAPLTLPPDFSIRPPAPGAGRPQEPEQFDRARQALTGRTRSDGGQSSGTAALLNRAGADRAQPDIRATVNREAGTISAADETLLSRLLSRESATDRVVDPQGETARIRDAQSQGRPPTQGDTPVIRPPRRGLFDLIF